MTDERKGHEAREESAQLKDRRSDPGQRDTETTRKLAENEARASPAGIEQAKAAHTGVGARCGDRECRTGR